MSFFDEMAEMTAEMTASDMFADASLTRQAVAAYDRISKRTIPGSSTAIACRVVLEEVTRRAENGALFQETVATLNVEPKDGDKLTVGSEAFRVGTVKRIAPNGTAILYQAVVTR